MFDLADDGSGLKGVCVRGCYGGVVYVGVYTGVYGGVVRTGFCVQGVRVYGGGNFGLKCAYTGLRVCGGTCVQGEFFLKGACTGGAYGVRVYGGCLCTGGA